MWGILAGKLIYTTCSNVNNASRFSTSLAERTSLLNLPALIELSVGTCVAIVK